MQRKDPDIQKLVIRLDKENPEHQHTLAEMLLKAVLEDNGEWDIIEGKFLIDAKAKENYIKALEQCIQLKAKGYIDFKYSRVSVPYECHFIDIYIKPDDIATEIPIQNLIDLFSTTLNQHDEEGKYLAIKASNPYEWSLSYKIYHEA